MDKPTTHEITLRDCWGDINKSFGLYLSFVSILIPPTPTDLRLRHNNKKIKRKRQVEKNMNIKQKIFHIAMCMEAADGEYMRGFIDDLLEVIE